MWYSIIGEDVPDSLPLRKELRPAHLERIEELSKVGRVLAAGPNPVEDFPLTEGGSNQRLNQPTEAGFSGSIMIVDFDSLEEATRWANGDPYLTGGVFSKVTVKPFMKVLP